MGRATRPRPERLGEKLKAIRLYLGFTQAQMAEQVTYKGSIIVPSQISEFERDIKEPPSPTVLRYARAVKIPMDYLIDDEMDLPAKIRPRS